MGGAQTSAHHWTLVILPRLRAEISVTSHAEDGESYLVLHDPFGVADGPIMLHADMIEVLSVCDGETTSDDLALAAGVDPDGPEIRRVILFVRQLEEMGFFEGPDAASRYALTQQAWHALSTRPMVCAGSTYPADPEEFRAFCRDVLGIVQRRGEAPLQNDVATAEPVAALIPHIDFRVAPEVYGQAFNAIAESPADLVVMIGTSHYWSDHPVIVSNKPFETPIGTLPVIDHDLAIAEADIAHKPEHSLELHAVALRYLWEGRDVAILPVLVTTAIFEQGALQEWTARIQEVVEASGRRPIWLISGDLAHVGPKFGDPLDAVQLMSAVEASDRELLELLADGVAERYRRAIENVDNQYRICGFAPTVLTLNCVQPGRGDIGLYQVWHEEETQSAVTFASAVWQK